MFSFPTKFKTSLLQSEIRVFQKLKLSNNNVMQEFY